VFEAMARSETAAQFCGRPALLYARRNALTKSPSQLPDGNSSNKTLRWNLIGLFLALVVAIGFVFLIETGELVEWLSRNRNSKIDEVIVVAVLFLLGICILFVRRWLGLSIQVATSSEPETVSFVARARRGLRRDLMGIGIALFGAVVLVFLFDTGWLVEWLAQHKGAKIDEIIVVSIVLLIGLSFFSVRRSIELTDHLQKYQELHEKTAKLNRQAALMAELGDMLQSCLSLSEAYPIITNRAQVLLPGSAGAVCTISSSRNMVEVVGTWEHPSLSESFFTPEECWALRRGRIHVSGKVNEALSCPHVAQPRPGRALCVPMMAHGETLGLLYVDTGRDGTEVRNAVQPADLDEPMAKTLAEQAALALANLKLREVLRTQSVRDPLTNLYNRRYMEESLDRELSRAVRKNLLLSLMLIDVDHFKQFNDTFGHDAGDVVLRSLGSLLLTQLRREDIVCRYGGEEFIVILPDAPLDSARQRGEQLREATKELVVEFRGQALGKITLSIGVATFPQNGTTGSALVEAADAALYQAKREGRDRIVLA
jgi:diguanylate cyclase (GGDEF)-like protein